MWILELGGVFGGGGSFRSGVQPPTGSGGDVYADLELQGDIWRGWIVPVGGSTPDRLRGAALGNDRESATI